MKQPLISIVVPVFNTAKYLDRCICSIIEQTYENLDIIVIDDGSEDESLEIIKRYAKKDSRIRWFNQENHGIAFTRVFGIKEARGEYLGFIDSDDWIEPDMYEALMNIMRAYNCGCISSGAVLHDLDGRVLYDYDNYADGLYTDLPHDIYPTMLHDFRIGLKGLRCFLVNKLFRVQILQSIIDEIDLRVFYGEDAMIMYRYCLRCDSIYILRKAYYHYVYRNNSAEQRKNEREAENICWLYNNLKQAFERIPEESILMRQLKQHILLKEWERVLQPFFNIDMSLLDVWDFSAYRQVFGKQVLVYGAGRCGQAFYKELLRLGYQDKIVAWVDKKPKGISAENIHPVEPVDVIRNKVYDFVAVAIKNEKMAREAIAELREKWGVPEEKIVWGESSCRSNWNTAYI